MNIEDFSICCKKLFEFNNLPIPHDGSIQKLFSLTQIMLDVNRIMNLTAITDEKNIITRHYIDSLSISRFIPKDALVADIGCGAGFPSLPLAIFRPDITITAVDSTAKRIKYVNDTSVKLGLTNITAIAARAEDIGKSPEYREHFDIVTARAVASLPVLSELCLPLVAVGGCFIAMKSVQADEETERSLNAISLCGGNISGIEKSALTSDGLEFEKRCLIMIDKARKTPKIYPRLFSQISKKPL